MKAFVLSFVAGLAAAAGFEPIGFWPLTLVAFAFLVRLLINAPRLRSALALGWWFGLGNFVLGLNWIATAFTFQAKMPPSLGWIAVVLLSCYLAVYPAMAAGLAWRWGRRDLLLFVLVFAAGWIVTEWLRATMFTGFAWNPVGVALLPTPLAKLSTLIGTYGLSGIALLLAGALLLLVRRRWQSGTAIAVSAAAAAGLAHLVHGPADVRPGMAIRIVQPNIGQEQKWRPGFREEALRRLNRYTGGGAGEPRLVLWPEAAITDPLEDGRDDPLAQIQARQAIRDAAGSLGLDDVLLTGGVTWRSADGKTVTSATNSVFVINPAERILARYDKAHLVPYGEYLPARPILSAIGLSRLAPGSVDFDYGPGPRTFALERVGKIGFQLCYEIVFSGEVVDSENRPDFLFNPSNDAWFGAFGPPQHLAQARMRAIEEGLPILRSTPTGISAVIDAEGRLLASIPWRQAGVIDSRLPRPSPPTLFSRFGNLLPFAFALLLVAAAIAVSRKTR